MSNMITGAHSIIYSKHAEADIAFFRDVLKLTFADLGHGWLIFGLPPSELAIHPATETEKHELYLICDDIEEFVEEMAKCKISCDAVQDQGWGRLTEIRLPGGGKLGVYQPKHERPESKA
jgi:hypothetical protein